MADGTPAAVRFWAKVNKDGPIPCHRPNLGACWIWTGALNSGGYGSFFKGPKKGSGSTCSHRWAWSSVNGEIPEGWEVDHLCKVPACVNPSHLEAVTRRENNLRSDSPAAQRARQTHCKRGHPLSGDNVLREGRHGRKCRTCKNMRQRIQWRMEKADG